MKALIGAKVEQELNDRLLLTAKTTGVSLSKIVEESLAQYLDQPAELIGDRFSVIEKKLLQIGSVIAEEKFRLLRLKLS